MRIFLIVLVLGGLAAGDASVPGRKKTPWSECAGQLESARLQMVQRGYTMFDGSMIDVRSDGIVVHFADGSGKRVATASISILQEVWRGVTTDWHESAYAVGFGGVASRLSGSWLASLSYAASDSAVFEHSAFERLFESAADSCLLIANRESASRIQSK